jgi:hypothetical protein
MKSIIAAAVIFSCSVFATLPASAGERFNEAVMGAGSGALVGGPIGAVAGGVIGFTAGPHIRRGMGIRHHRHYHRHSYYHRRSHR